MAPYLMLICIVICLFGWMGIPSRWILDLEASMDGE